MVLAVLSLGEAMSHLEPFSGGSDYKCISFDLCSRSLENKVMH